MCPIQRRFILRQRWGLCKRMRLNACSVHERPNGESHETAPHFLSLLIIGFLYTLTFPLVRVGRMLQSINQAVFTSRVGGALFSVFAGIFLPRYFRGRNNPNAHERRVIVSSSSTPLTADGHVVHPREQDIGLNEFAEDLKIIAHYEERIKLQTQRL